MRIPKDRGICSDGIKEHLQGADKGPGAAGRRRQLLRPRLQARLLWALRQPVVDVPAQWTKFKTSVMGPIDWVSRWTSILY